MKHKNERRKNMTIDYKPSLPSMMVVGDLLIVANGRSNDKVQIYDKETLSLKSKITLADRTDYDRALLFPIEGDEYICGFFFPFFGDVYGLKKGLTSKQLKVGKVLCGCFKHQFRNGVYRWRKY